MENSEFKRGEMKARQNIICKNYNRRRGEYGARQDMREGQQLIPGHLIWDGGGASGVLQPRGKGNTVKCTKSNYTPPDPGLKKEKTLKFNRTDTKGRRGVTMAKESTLRAQPMSFGPVTRSKSRAQTQTKL